MKAKTFKIVAFSCAAVLLAILIAATVVFSIFEPMIEVWFSTTSIGSAARAEGEALATQIEEEGIVLTKNDDDVLPLEASQVSKVNVFGWSSTQWIMGGSGSGRSTTSSGSFIPTTGLLEALEAAGIEYNTALTDKYKAFHGQRPFLTTGNGGALSVHDYEYCRLYEPSFDSYSADLLNGARDFSDTALVVLGRITGESIDCPTVQYKNTDALGVPTNAENIDETRTYLDASVEELDLLQYVGSNFKNVIVIINSTNTMNLGFMNEITGLDSCLIVGGTGDNGATGIVNVLFGEKIIETQTDDNNKTSVVKYTGEQVLVSPSGRTVDTYVYDFTTNPGYAYTAMQGVDQYLDTLGTKTYYPTTTTNGNVGSSNGDKDYPGVSYLDYVEGIYVGYKWYETADAENFWSSSFAKSTWGVSKYEDVVQYPFGYGMSYTDFEWVTAEWNVDKDNDEITVKVQVKNVGKYPSQEVVELYFTPPYTKGGIEKAAVNLCAFGKTPTYVQPNEAQFVTLTVKISDLASYDQSGEGGYVLEKGDYTLSLRTDSHNVAKVTAGGAEYKYNSDKVENKDLIGLGNDVHNLFGANGSDGIAIDGSNTNQDIPWLSREDFAGTFVTVKDKEDGTVAGRNMHDLLKESNLYYDNSNYNSSKFADAWLEKNKDAADIGAVKDNGIRIFSGYSVNEAGLEYGKPENFDNKDLWDPLLQQISVSEMENLVLHGYSKEEVIKSIGKTEVSKSADGPAQIGSFATGKGVGYPMPTVLAQSWNEELSKSFGLRVGEQTLGTNRKGWYAPGCNIHRSAFGGRNYEYYSEDGFLSGVMCAATVRGALNAGVYTYIKHLIGYDQDSLRDSLYCWMSEQALREIYLKPFKLAVDEGATGLMSSYGRIGAIWAGGSEALLTDLLRDEWGFKGTVLTDYADHHEFMNGDQMLRAGGDLWMDGAGTAGTFKVETSSNAYKQALRTATKHIIYMECNAEYEKAAYAAGDGDEITFISNDGVQVFPWWTMVIVIVDVLLAAGAGVLIFFGIKKKDKPVAEANAAEASEPTSPADDTPNE